MENVEINNIIKIVGLQHKKKYESIDDLKTLRYGRLMIMTDQDQVNIATLYRLAADSQSRGRKSSEENFSFSVNSWLWLGAICRNAFLFSTNELFLNFSYFLFKC